MTKYMKRAGIDFSICYRELNQSIKDVCIEKVNILSLLQKYIKFQKLIVNFLV